MPGKHQPTFTRGEVSPLMHGRVDLAAYQAGLRTCRNFFTLAQGGVSNRPGTEFIGWAKQSTQRARLIPFEFNVTQTYVLEFGHNYFRIIKDGAHVLEPTVAISDITQADPGVVTASGHGYSAGDWVEIDGVVGMTEVNGKTYTVANPTGTTFELNDIDGNNVDTSSFTAYSSAGTVARYKTVTTTYTESELRELNYTQSADVLTIVHPNHAPAEVKRGPAGHHDFSIADITFGPSVSPPTSVFATQAESYNIVSTGFDLTNPARVYVGRAAGDRINNGDKIFIDDAGGTVEANGRWYYVHTKDGATANRYAFKLQDEDGDDVDGTGWTAWTSGGKVYTEDEFEYYVTAVDEDTGEESLASAVARWAPAIEVTEDTPVNIKWTPPSGNIRSFNVYKKKNGLFGFIGSRLNKPGPDIEISSISTATPSVVTTSSAHGLNSDQKVHFENVSGPTNINDRTFRVRVLTNTTFEIYLLMGTDVTADAPGMDGKCYLSPFWFEDDNIAPELGDVAPPDTSENPFDAASDYPGAVAFYSQRRVFARTDNDIQKVWASQIGNIYNMNHSEPLKPDDAISFVLPARKANEIRHLISMRELFILTSGGEWVSSSGDGTYTIENISNRQHTENGISQFPAPLPVSNTFLYVQEKGGRVFDFLFSFDQDGFQSQDLTVLSEHLFESKDIVEWAYQNIPNRCVWAVLDDGDIAACTFMPEQQILGWHRHDTDGDFESVAVVGEGNEDFVYFVVKRTINGTERRFVERLHTRVFTDIQDAFFVDAGLTLDDPKTITAATKANPVQITSAAHGFDEGSLVDITEVVGMTELNDNRYRAVNTKTNTFELAERTLGKRANMTNATQADPVEVTFEKNADGLTLETGDACFIEDVNGMTEINDRYFLVTVVSFGFSSSGLSTVTVSLQDLDGADIDGTGFGAYTSGGKISKAFLVDGSGFTAYVSDGKVREAFSTFSGLDHLEGETVSVLANGFVEPQQTVSGGQITLPSQAASRVHVGLPYTSQIETLDLTDPSGELAGRFRSISKVIFRLYRTRGLFYGPVPTRLTEHKQRTDEDYGVPTKLQNGEGDIVIDPDWNNHGRVFIEQTDPLPATIQSVTVEFEAGER